MPFSPQKYASSKQIRASVLLLLHRKGNKWKSFGGIGEKIKKKKEQKNQQPTTKADALGETCRPNPQSL